MSAAGLLEVDDVCDFFVTVSSTVLDFVSAVGAATESLAPVTAAYGLLGLTGLAVKVLGATTFSDLLSTAWLVAEESETRLAVDEDTLPLLDLPLFSIKQYDSNIND